MTFLAVIINSTDKIKSLGYVFAGASLAGFLSMLVITKLRMWNDFYKQTVEYALHLGADDRPLRGLINFRIIMFGLLFIFILMLFKNLKNAGAKSLKNRVLKIFMILILWISIGIIMYFLAKFKYSKLFGRISENTGASPITITGIMNQILAMCGLGTS